MMRIGVIGAGAMGGGIAHVAAAAGHEVVLGDVSAEAVDRARAQSRTVLERDVTKGRREQGDVEPVLARLQSAGPLGESYAAFAECDLVLEAVAELLPLKQQIFASLESVVRDDCVLATNTSSLSVAAIAGGLTHPERVIGIHFFNPAPVMPLVEIIPSIITDAAVLERAASLIGGWKKTVVVASDTPGFIVNRLARPFYGESLRQLEEQVADVATIDWAMRELGGFRMGPFELMDFIGNDVNYAVTTSVFEAFYNDPRYRPSLTQRRLVEAGLYGRKRSRGYYDYRDGAERRAPTVDRELGQRIVDRTVAMLVNEAAEARLLNVASADDLETAMLTGVNYPKGLLAWGDEIGPATVLERLEALHAEYGDDRYRPSVWLRRCVRDGRTLRSS